MWVANAGGGTGPKVQSETLSGGGTLRYHARLIRGPVPATPPQPRFRARGDGIVEDSLTGLMWQQTEVASPMDWGQALQSAENLTLGGFQDWRLPNIRELRSLNDEGRSGPSIDTAAFLGASRRAIGLPRCRTTGPPMPGSSSSSAASPVRPLGRPCSGCVPSGAASPTPTGPEPDSRTGLAPWCELPLDQCRGGFGKHAFAPALPGAG